MSVIKSLLGAVSGGRVESRDRVITVRGTNFPESFEGVYAEEHSCSVEDMGTDGVLVELLGDDLEELDTGMIDGVVLRRYISCDSGELCGIDLVGFIDTQESLLEELARGINKINATLIDMNAKVAGFKYCLVSEDTLEYIPERDWYERQKLTDYRRDSRVVRVRQGGMVYSGGVEVLGERFFKLGMGTLLQLRKVIGDYDLIIQYVEDGDLKIPVRYKIFCK